METTRIQNGQTERIEVLALDDAGDPVVGLGDVELSIRRLSDGMWLDFDDNTFKDADWVMQAQIMSDVDTILAPGQYYYDFDTTGFDDDTYQLRVECGSAANFPQIGEIKAGGYVDFISDIKTKIDNLPVDTEAELQIIQALSGKNTRLFNTTYENNKLISGTIRGYASKADLETDQNHVVEILVNVTKNINGNVETHIRKDSQ